MRHQSRLGLRALDLAAVAEHDALVLPHESRLIVDHLGRDGVLGFQSLKAREVHTRFGEQRLVALQARPAPA